jgi:DNA-binding FadR family transcriptional regulator
VAQLATLVATHEDFERLEDMIATQRRAVDDPYRLRRLDAQFHLMIAEAAHNRTVMLMMHALYERLELTRHPTIQPDEGAHTLDVHERTLSALMSRDPEAVERMMDEHLSVMEDAWERETGGSFKRAVPEFLARSRDSGTDRRASPDLIRERR